MMAPMLGLTSDPAELGFVVSHFSSAAIPPPHINASHCRVRMGVGFAITGMSLMFAFTNGSRNARFGLFYLTKALVD